MPPKRANNKKKKNKKKANSAHVTATATAVTAGSTRAVLMDDDGDWFTPAFEAALDELFARLDVDNDRAWSLAEVQSFAQLCNGEDFSEQSLQEMRDCLTHTDDDKLTLTGLKELYHLQCTSGNEAETWKDLYRWGYNDALTHVGAAATADAAAAAAAVADAVEQPSVADNALSDFSELATTLGDAAADNAGNSKDGTKADDQKQEIASAGADDGKKDE